MFGTRGSGTQNPTVLVTEGDSWAGFYASWALLKYNQGANTQNQNQGAAGRVTKVISAVRDRNNDFVRELEKLGAEIREYDPKADRNQLERQLLRNEVDGLVLIPVHDMDNMVKSTSELIAAVDKDQKCQSLVLWSLIGTEHQGGHSAQVGSNADPKHGNWKRILSDLAQIEKQVRSAKVEHEVIIRHGWAAQQFFALSQVIQNRGIMPFTSKTNKFAPANAKDVARASAALISCPENMKKYNKQSLTLTGPRAHSIEDITQIMNSTLHAKIDLKEVTMRDVEQILEDNEDVDDVEMAKTLALMDLIKRDKLNQVTGDIQKLIGQSPSDVDAFFQENADSFRPNSSRVEASPFIRDIALGLPQPLNA